MIIVDYILFDIEILNPKSVKIFEPIKDDSSLEKKVEVEAQGIEYLANHSGDDHSSERIDFIYWEKPKLDEIVENRIKFVSHIKEGVKAKKIYDPIQEFVNENSILRSVIIHFEKQGYINAIKKIK